MLVHDRVRVCFAAFKWTLHRAQRRRNEGREMEKNRCRGFVEDLSLNSEQQVLPVLLNMN